MISELNRVVIMGNVAGTPYFETDAEGKTTFCVMRLASHRTYKHPEKDEVSDTTYVTCVLHKYLAGLAAKLLTKGDKLIIEGRLSNHEREIAGEKITEVQLVVENFIRCSLKKETPPV